MKYSIPPGKMCHSQEGPDSDLLNTGSPLAFAWTIVYHNLLVTVSVRKSVSCALSLSFPQDCMQNWRVQK